MFRSSLSTVVRLVSRAGITALLTTFPLLTPDVALAQSAVGNRTISGVVLDPDAKAVVGAAVLARNELSADLQTTTTDGRGHFSIVVPAGTYAVEIAVPGFEIVRRNGIDTAARDTQELSIHPAHPNTSQNAAPSVEPPAAPHPAP